MNKDNIVFYQDWFEAILEIPVEKQLQEFLNIFNYGYYNIVPKSKSDDFGFKAIMLAIDRNNKKYSERCAINKKNAEKRWTEDTENTINENDRPKKLIYIKNANNANNAKDANGTKHANNAKHANSANDADNDNDNDNDNEVIEKSNALFATYQLWIKENAPYCGNSEKFKQLTANELWQLATKYSIDRIKGAILNLEKKKSVRKKYAELYKVLSDSLEKTNHSF